MKVLGIWLLVMLFLIGSAVSLSAAPPFKVTGGVEFTRMDGGHEVTAKAEFVAHMAYDDHPAKGLFQYRDSDGRTLRLDVECLYIHVCADCCCATFSGPVFRTSEPEWSGMWLQVWVTDCGSSGFGHDMIGGSIYDYDPDCQLRMPPEWWPVTKGNLQIHPRCWTPPTGAMSFVPRD